MKILGMTPPICAAIIFLAGGSTMSQHSNSRVMMEIYFVPFAIETYIPITMDEIVDKAHHVIWFSKEHPLISKLRRLLTSAISTARVDNDVIRLKVSFQGQQFFVDKDGVVVDPTTGTNYVLTHEQLVDIETSILYFSGVIDVKASKEVMRKNEKKGPG